VREEIRAKPWAHSTHLGGAEVFANAVEGNLLMAEYE
jgi:cyanamide hydratase